LKVKKSVQILLFLTLLSVLTALTLNARIQPAKAEDSPEMTPTGTASPTGTAEPSMTPDMTGTPEATGTASPTPTSSPTGTIEPFETPQGTATVTPADYYDSYLPVLADMPPLAPPGCVPFAYIPPSSLSSEQKLTMLLNDYRIDNLESRLNNIPQLSQAARLHAKDLAEHDLISHFGSDGSSVGSRVSSACYEWLHIGEILGNGEDAKSMFASWIQSDANRELIQSTEYIDFGIGYHYNPDSVFKHYWVVVFARPVSAGQYLD
jgi:uncharacterized protein YkwD